MDLSIAALLTQDGITNGAIYALLALALVLVFAVTRIIWVPSGEFVAYGTLTLAGMQLGKPPGTVSLLVGMAIVAGLLEVYVCIRRGEIARAPRRLQEFIDSCINGCVSARMKTMRRRIALSKHLVGVVSKEGVADGVEDETAPLSQCFEEESGTLAKKFAFGSSPSEVKRITTRAAFVSSTDWPPTLPIVGESVNL